MSRLQDLMARGAAFLGCDIAIMAGAMAGSVRAQSGLRHVECGRLRRDCLRGDDAGIARH